MPDVFVSYVREDFAKVKVLVRAMEERGWKVFWDRLIPTGTSWRELIGIEINNAKCIVVLWSNASVNSHWVQEEADIGRQRCVLVPVLIEDVQPPLGFRSLQAADLSKWEGKASTRVIQDLFNDISTIVNGTPTTRQRDESDKGLWQNVRVPALAYGLIIISVFIFGFYAKFESVDSHRLERKQSALQASQTWATLGEVGRKCTETIAKNAEQQLKLADKYEQAGKFSASLDAYQQSNKLFNDAIKAVARGSC